MRFRSAALLSTAMIAALALAGCSSDGAPSDDDAASKDPLCAAAGPTGDVVESLDVSGTGADGAPDSIDVGDGAEPEAFQRAVVTEGDGPKLADGDFFSYAIAVYDAKTGEQIGANGYGEDDRYPPAQLTLQPQSQLDQQFPTLIGCAPVGSRIATAYPASTGEDGTKNQAIVQIIDVLSTPEKKAWGEDVAPEAGMPTVELAEDGEPTITIPDDLKIPDETKVATLKQGDGREVTGDDTVYVQYKGVKASDGEEFDSSWSRGQVSTFPVAGVVEGFQKALVGQKVGSQVVAVLPKEEAYHVDQEGAEQNELYDEDLVFVVDIVDSYTPPAHAAE